MQIEFKDTIFEVICDSINIYDFEALVVVLISKDTRFTRYFDRPNWFYFSHHANVLIIIFLA